MLIIFGQERFMKVAKIICVVIMLAVILFYVLPKLISHLLWIDPHDNNIHFNNYQAPLRVENILAFHNFKFKN
ncbi:MAG: hypothetical protein H6Q70_2460 [Firmicutes bacterium]|nr:hypothetical protein [Bacillota bacterium]